MKLDTEREGELFAIGTMLLLGATPVLSKMGVTIMSPLLLLGMSALGAAVLLFPFALKQGLGVLISKEYGPKLFLMSGLASCVAFVLVLYGTSMTSAINASILLQTEVFYSIIISYLLLHEKITLKQVIFTSLILMGTILVVFNGSLAINIGDILIIIAPVFYQLSHMVGKGLVKELHPFQISFARCIYPGVIFTVASIIFVPNQFALLNRSDAILLIALQMLFGFALSFPLWYSALKRINLSKATGLIMPYPVISLLLAVFLLHEMPSIYQLAGLGLTLTGILLLTKVKSEKREKKQQPLPSALSL